MDFADISELFLGEAATRANLPDPEAKACLQVCHHSTTA
jgi:hypothetical protein